MVLRSESHECKPGTRNSATVDCTGLRTGSYILHIDVDGQPMSEKFNVR